MLNVLATVYLRSYRYKRIFYIKENIFFFAQNVCNFFFLIKNANVHYNTTCFYHMLFEYRFLIKKLFLNIFYVLENVHIVWSIKYFSLSLSLFPFFFYTWTQLKSLEHFKCWASYILIKEYVRMQHCLTLHIHIVISIFI